MKYKLILALALLAGTLTQAQSPQHKIVFDMVSSDTLDHQAIMRQINNILTEAPNTKVEVVFHGQAAYALVKQKSTIQASVDEMVKNKNLTFAVCNNSLKRLKLTPADVISSAIVVPVAMLELAKKEEQGWSYIKAGH